MTSKSINYCPTLSIIIVSWNTRELLIDCLRSVEVACGAYSSFSAEIIVVDNASSDDSVACTQAQFPAVKVLENVENVGFARANNQAIHESRGKYVLLLNPDTLIDCAALATLVAFMEQNADVGAAGSLLRNPNGTLQPSCYVAPTPARELWRLLHLDVVYPIGDYHMHKWLQNCEREVDIVQGASLIVRRDVIDSVGDLDAEYFMYSEDFDWCHRIRQAGWRIYWVPQSVVIHYGGQSTVQVATPMFLQLYRAKLQFFRKHYGRVTGVLYKLVLLIVSVIRLIASPLALVLSTRKRSSRLALAQRYAQLIWALPRM